VIRIEVLHTFAALALSCGVVSALLPDGAIRKTASLVMGLMMTLCWLESLTDHFQWPSLPQAAETVLSDTALHGEDYTAALDVYERLLSSRASAESGQAIQVKLDADGAIAQLIIPQECDQQSLLRACQAIGADPALAVSSAAGR